MCNNQNPSDMSDDEIDEETVVIAAELVIVAAELARRQLGALYS